VAWLAYFCAEKRCWHFCTFLHNPHFDFEPDYVIRKPQKQGFQRYIVRTEIFSSFHARVEYISVKTVIGQIDLPTPRAAMTPPQSIYRLLRTDGQTASVTIYPPPFTTFTWRILLDGWQSSAESSPGQLIRLSRSLLQTGQILMWTVVYRSFFQRKTHDHIERHSHLVSQENFIGRHATDTSSRPLHGAMMFMQSILTDNIWIQPESKKA